MKNANILAVHIAELQAKEDRLDEYEKLLAKAIQVRYGIDPKVFEKMLKNTDENDPFSRVKSYFNLCSEKDIESFTEIMCNESSLRYFQGHLSGNAQAKVKSCKGTSD